MNVQIQCRDIVDSTNLWAKEAAMQGAPEGTLLVADQQSAGDLYELDSSAGDPAGAGIYADACDGIVGGSGGSGAVWAGRMDQVAK